MKLIKNYKALKYAASNRNNNGNNGMNGNTITDPMAWVTSFALHARKTPNYNETEEGIYRRIETDGTDSGKFVTSLFFVQEPELGEGENATKLSPELVKALTEKFGCAVSDSYEYMNEEDSNVCYLEFESSDENALKELRAIIGKHVFLKDKELIIE